jgi:hypothetical protein
VPGALLDRVVGTITPTQRPAGSPARGEWCVLPLSRRRYAAALVQQLGTLGERQQIRRRATRVESDGALMPKRVKRSRCAVLIGASRHGPARSASHAIRA